MPFIVALIFAITAFMLVLMGKLIITGRANRRTRHDPGAIAIHRAHATHLAYATIGLVLVIVVGIRLLGRSVNHDAVFWTHEALAFGYAATLVLLFRKTGLRSKYHPYIAYANFGFFLALACVALPMMWQRF